MDVAVKDGKLTFSVPGQPTYTLEPVQGRRYRLAGMKASSSRSGRRRPTRKRRKFIWNSRRATNLKRIAPADAKTAAASGASAEYTGPLKEVIGTYSSEGEGPALEVLARDGKVVLVIPGQPAYPLIERSKDVLGSTALPEAYSFLVRRDAAGNIVGITVKQPEGEFAFKRAADSKPVLTADEIMTKVVEAMGGEAAIRKHKSWRATLEMDFEHQGVQGEGVVYAKAPNAVAQDVTFVALGKKLGALHDYFDGAQGGEEGTFFPFEPKTGKELDRARVTSDFYSPLEWKRLYKSAEVKRVAKVGGEDAYVVVFTPEKGNAVTDYYSTKSFLLLRQDTTQTTSPVERPRLGDALGLPPRGRRDDSVQARAELRDDGRHGY